MPIFEWKSKCAYVFTCTHTHYTHKRTHTHIILVYTHGLIPVGIISISEVVRTMFVDEIALKQRINSETVLRDFVVFTCEYDNFWIQP